MYRHFGFNNYLAKLLNTRLIKSFLFLDIRKNKWKIDFRDICDYIRNIKYLQANLTKKMCKIFTLKTAKH